VVQFTEAYAAVHSDTAVWVPWVMKKWLGQPNIKMLLKKTQKEVKTVISLALPYKSLLVVAMCISDCLPQQVSSKGTTCDGINIQAINTSVTQPFQFVAWLISVLGDWQPLIDKS